MTIDIVKNIFRFFLLVLVQILILNNIQLSGYINPYLYVLFILMLPLDTPKWLLLIFSFLLGFTVDIFSDSSGMHAAAATFMGYVRPYVLDIIKPRGGYEFTSKPTISDMGINWFVAYSGILIFLHHLVYFFIEIFRFGELLSIVSRVVMSSIFTLILAIIVQLIFSKPKTA